MDINSYINILSFKIDCCTFTFGLHKSQVLVNKLFVKKKSNLQKLWGLCLFRLQTYSLQQQWCARSDLVRQKQRRPWRVLDSRRKKDGKREKDGKRRLDGRRGLDGHDFFFFGLKDFFYLFGEGIDFFLDQAFRVFDDVF